MSEKKTTTKNVKKRNWAFVLYPESAPSDWMEQLQATGLPIAISPLHDRDLDPTGEPKKAHYHIILCYQGPTSYNVVKAITDGLGQPIPQPLESVRGYYRYLSHKDNPDKVQYSEADIQHLNGFNILDFAELTKSEVAAMVLTITKLIRERLIMEYSDLIYHLIDAGMYGELEIASNRTIYFDALIRSQRNKFKDNLGRTIKVNIETGEFLEDGEADGKED